MAQETPSTALVSAYSSHKGAQAEKKARYIEAAGYEQEARLIDLQTRQQGVNRSDELNSSLAAIEAVRASRNLATDSPTAMAVDRAVRAEMQLVSDNEKLTGAIAARQRRTAAAGARLAGKQAMFAGWIKTLSHLKSLVSFSSSFNGTPSGLASGGGIQNAASGYGVSSQSAAVKAGVSGAKGAASTGGTIAKGAKALAVL